MKFTSKRENGILSYHPDSSDKISIVECSGKYCIRMMDNNEWVYPYWSGIQNGFNSITEAQEWLQDKDVDNATIDSIDVIQSHPESPYDELGEAMDMLGFESEQADLYTLSAATKSGNSINIMIKNTSGMISTSYSVDGILMNAWSPKPTRSVSRTIRNVERILSTYQVDLSPIMLMTDVNRRSAVLAAASSRDLTQNLVRVRSSNVWAYGINIKNRKDRTGDLVVQFKNKNGGAGDVYIYYDVPVQIFRRWQSATSVGHYFWVYIRNHYNYSKLTGNKRGMLPNAVNH